MAKYQKYAEYQDSGVEWLGEIPSHWNQTYLKYVVLINMGQSPSSEDCNIDGIGIPFLQGNAEFGTYSPTAKNYCPIPKKIADKGDLLFSVRAPVGALNYADMQYGIGRGLCSLKSRSSINSSFLWWVLPTYKYQLDAIATGSTFEAVSAEEVANLKFPLPTIVEQQKIANFLDHETTQIDTLIAKQEKLIELLKEKRQAVISHAVTKGLNPDVTMKDSGVEWLGQVPEHWKCIKIKHITTTFEQGWSPQCDSRPAESHEYGVLKVGCVNSGSFRSSENKALPPELEPRLQYLIQKDDLLISRANTKELVGSASVVNGDYPNLILCDKLYRLRFSKNVLPEMVSLYLSIGAVRKQIELGATGASHSMQNIGQDTIKELYYLLPPYEEALNILESIKQSNQKFDELTKKAESAIQLMQERRTALISSAVTGKIDVRNWQHPNEAKTELSL